MHLHNKKSVASVFYCDRCRTQLSLHCLLRVCERRRRRRDNQHSIRKVRRFEDPRVKKMKKTQAGISTHVCTRRTGSLLIYAIITESRMSSTPHAACAAARIPRRFRGLTCFSFCVYCESELVVSAANLFHTESLPKKKKKKKKTSARQRRLSSHFASRHISSSDRRRVTHSRLMWGVA